MEDAVRPGGKRSRRNSTRRLSVSGRPTPGRSALGAIPWPRRLPPRRIRGKVGAALTPDLLRDHLLGKIRIGIYSTEKTSWIGFDFDGKNPKLKPIGPDAAWASSRRSPPWSTRTSASGPSSPRSPAAASATAHTCSSIRGRPHRPEAKTFGKLVLQAAGLPDDEKEDSLTLASIRTLRSPSRPAAKGSGRPCSYRGAASSTAAPGRCSLTSRHASLSIARSRARGSQACHPAQVLTATRPPRDDRGEHSDHHEHLGSTPDSILTRWQVLGTRGARQVAALGAPRRIMRLRSYLHSRSSSPRQRARPVVWMLPTRRRGREHDRRRVPQGPFECGPSTTASRRPRRHPSRARSRSTPTRSPRRSRPSPWPTSSARSVCT